VWTLVPAITNNNLPLDTIEALAWGSNLDWGFDKHPPASAFFVEFFYQIFGSQDWVYYFLSQIFVTIAFFVVFKFAEELLNNKLLSLISVFLLEGIYFYNFTTPEFNVNVAQLPFWALTVYYSWRIFSKEKIDLKDNILLGIFAAIGFLSKYLFVYLLVTIDFLFFYIIFIKKEKKYDYKYLISFTVFLILLVPHLIWLIDNDYITITYGLGRAGLENSNFLNHLTYPLLFLGKQIGILIPFFIMSLFLIKKFEFKINLKDKKLLFLISINLIPIALMLLTSIFTGSKIRTMWMTPFYLFIGVLTIYVFQMEINLKKLNGFLSAFLFIFIFSPFFYAYVSVTQEDKRTDYLGKEIAQKIQLEWNKNFNEPINVVLGNEWNAGNLSYHLNSRPVWKGFIENKKLDKLNKYICIDKICVGN
jgi:4-amino-4-deoxy-L-arabinose transferase-like glycosyltransferase